MTYRTYFSLSLSLKLFLETFELLSQHSYLGFQCFHLSFERGHPIIGPAPASDRRFATKRR